MSTTNSPTKKKILITGGCGFIGSNFINFLFSNKNDEIKEIINIDSLTYAGNISNTNIFNNYNNYFFHEIDIRDFDKLNDVFRKYKPDIIVNFAAESHVDRSITNPNIFIETNLLGTNNLVTLALKFKSNLFVQVSTDEVYGDLDDTEPPFTEKSQIKPSSPYAASKAAADLLVLSFYRTFNFPVIITRCSNNYGPNQHIEKFIPKIINNSFQKQKIPVYGDGSNIRDWIYVVDHCSGIWQAIEMGTLGETYNFGASYELRNLEIINKIMSAMGCNENLIEYVDDRLGHDYRYAIDSSKAQKDLNWFPSTGFSEGILQTITWYRENTDWTNKLKF